MKKPGVTKRTRDRNVRRFADKSVYAWKCLNKFADSHCKKKCERERFVDELCDVVDGYVNLNCEILLWCHKNGVDPRDFVCDVENNSFFEKRKDSILTPMPKWTFQKNDGGACLLCEGVEVAHVPNIFSSDAANHGIPLGGMARAKWLCEILERKDVVPEPKSP